MRKRAGGAVMRKRAGAADCAGGMRTRKAAHLRSRCEAATAARAPTACRRATAELSAQPWMLNDILHYRVLTHYYFTAHCLRKA